MSQSLVIDIVKREDKFVSIYIYSENVKSIVSTNSLGCTKNHKAFRLLWPIYSSCVRFFYSILMSIKEPFRLFRAFDSELGLLPPPQSA